MAENNGWTPEKVWQHNDEIFLSKRDIIRYNGCFMTVATDPIIANETFSSNLYPHLLEVLKTDVYQSDRYGKPVVFTELMHGISPYTSVISMTREEGEIHHEEALQKVKKDLGLL